MVSIPEAVFGIHRTGFCRYRVDDAPADVLFEYYGAVNLVDVDIDSLSLLF
jgi:hypothetical protein